MNELEKLLHELKNMKSEYKQKFIENNRTTWEKIGKNEWKDLGIENEEELKQWLELNPYANI